MKQKQHQQLSLNATFAQLTGQTWLSHYAFASKFGIYCLDKLFLTFNVFKGFPGHKLTLKVRKRTLEQRYWSLLWCYFADFQHAFADWVEIRLLCQKSISSRFEIRKLLLIISFRTCHKFHIKFAPQTIKWSNTCWLPNTFFYIPKNVRLLGSLE